MGQGDEGVEGGTPRGEDGVEDGASHAERRVRGTMDSILRYYAAEPAARAPEEQRRRPQARPSPPAGTAELGMAARSDRRRRARPSVVLGGLAAAAVLAALLLALSGGGDGSHPVAVGPLARAAYVTAGTPGYKVAFTLSGTLGSHGFATSATGTINALSRRGTMAFTIAGRSTEEVIAYPELYLRTPIGPGGAPVAPTPWVGMNMADMVRAIGLNGSVIGSSDPTDELQLLRTAGHIAAVGTERIRGVQTSHYHAVVDLERYAAFVAPSLRPAVRQNAALVKRWTGTSTLPVDAWVDAQWRIRRFQLQFSACTRAGQLNEVVSMDVFDYGRQPDAVVPPAGEVTDITGAVISRTSQSLAALALGCGKSSASGAQAAPPSASPGTSPASVYAREGNAACQSALDDQRALLAPGSAADVTPYLQQQLQIEDRALRQLEALKAPAQDRAALGAGLGLAQRQEQIIRRALGQLRAGRPAATVLPIVLEQTRALNNRGNAEFRQAGLAVCAEN